MNPKLPPESFPKQQLQLQQKLQNRLCVIITNYGDDSLALIQWAIESPFLKNHRENQLLKVVTVDTGFAACRWAEQVAKGRAYVENAGLEAIHLVSEIPFANAAIGRGAFPSAKFQWCSTVLKGLPLLDWLDKVDPTCRSIILSAKRRETLIPPYDTLAEWIEKSEHFNDRSQWHPLIDMDEKTRDSLLENAHFQPLGHRSLECDPCINSSPKTLACLEKPDIQKVKILEETLGSSMFSKEDFADMEGEGIEAVVSVAQKSVAQQIRIETQQIEIQKKVDTKQRVTSQRSEDLTLFYRGCGNPFGCGM